MPGSAAGINPLPQQSLVDPASRKGGLEFSDSSQKRDGHLEA